MIQEGTLTINQNVQSNAEQLVLIYNSKKRQYEYQEKLAKKRLKAAQSIKEELSEKLKTIETQLQILNTSQNDNTKYNYKRKRQYSQDFSLGDRKQISEIQKEIERKEKEKQQKIKQFEEYLEQQNKLEQEEEKKQLEQMKAHNRDLSQQHIQKIKERQLKREQELEKINEQFKQVYSKTPYYVKLEQRFQESHIQTLEEKKKYLNEIRRLRMTPIDFDEIKNHSKKVMQTIQEHQLKQQQNTKSISIELNEVYQKPTFESKIYQIYLEDREKELKQEVEKERKRKKTVLRHKLYYDKIKNQYAPKIDESKQLEMKISKEIPNSRNFSVDINSHSKAVNDSIDLKQLGNDYMKLSKKYIKKNPALNISIQHEKLVTSPSNANNNLTENINFQSPQSQKTEFSKETTQQSNTLSVPNYLKEVNQKYSQYNISQLQMNKIDYYLKNPKNISATQKIQLLQVETHKLNQQLEQKEKKLKYQDNQVQRDEIAQIYIQSIKAKLAVLNEGVGSK